MKYDDELATIGAVTKQVASTSRRLHWNLRERARDTRQAAAQAKVKAWTAQHEHVRLLGAKELAGMADRIFTEESARAELTAGAARWQVEPRLRQLVEQYPGLVARARADVALSFPAALDGVDAGGMLTFYLLRETVRPAIEKAGAADLLRRYRRAVQTRDAMGLLETELIEARLDAGGVSATPEDLAPAKHLRELIEYERDLRVPLTIEQRVEIETTIEHARKTISLADLVQVRPIDTDHPANQAAKQAFEREAGAYQQAIEQAAGVEGDGA